MPSVHACGEDIQILENVAHLGGAVQNNGLSRQEGWRQTGLARGIMDALSTST